MASQVIVVGGGLAGLSAAHTVIEHGGRVLLLDKNAFLGGNSVRATSGINGAGTRTQRLQGIQDTVESFERDTAISANKGVEGPASPLAKVLTGESGPAVEWLINSFGLDLSLVSRLGGHSFPRTHRGKERFPGMTITYALMEKLEAIQSEGKGIARIISKARATRLLKDERGHIVGVEYEKDGQHFTEHGPVIIATGGYAADFTDNSLLAKFRPDLLHLPTTNGDHCTGDGIKMSMDVGADVEDMEWVQVHPTGLVDLAEPDAKVKFLAAEALRGVGGLLLDANGSRFCDELGRRDYVSGEMGKNKGPFRLVLNGAGGKEIEWHCKHYTSRGLMKHYNSGAELAADMGISADHLAKTFETYNKVAQNPPDEFGKKFFQNIPFVMNDEFWVAIVTPVVHYCMGGVKIHPDAAIVGKDGKAIPGLWATGEVCGGIHGKNRLGGNSLLDCVVYGRVSGASAARYALSENIKYIESGPRASVPAAGSVSGGFPATITTSNGAQIGATISNNGIQSSMHVDPSQRRVSMQISWDASVKAAGAGAAAAPAVTTSAPAAVAAAAAPPAANGTAGGAPTPDRPVAEQKVYTWDEIAKHNTEKDLWVVVRGQVLNATNFLKDHPGGKKAIIMWGGKDATAEFDMFHKPDVIDKYAPWTVIGTVEGPAPAHATEKGTAPPAAAPAGPTFTSSATAPSSGTVPVTTAKFTEPNNPISLQPIQPTASSNTVSRNSGGTADILPKERARATFDVNKMMNVLDGGVEGTKRRRFIISPTENMDTSDKYFWERPQLLAEHVKHFIATHIDYLDNFIPTREDTSFMSDNSMLSGSFINHYGLFVPTILGQASSEQQSWWLMNAMTLKMVGVYCQTELGHGSNVRGLRTTATYDKNTQEFILNTPSLQAIKWWVSGIGKVATHAAVYAQLILEGKEYGVHVFLVQVRDENHRPLPGIEVGDCGPKLGDNTNDTGFLRLENVRIPREHLFSRWQTVSPDGKYVKSEKKTNDKVHYATMLFARGGMLKGAGGYLAKAVTIATRYSCVRHQGFKDTSTSSHQSPERPIIDYQVQRYRIFKQLSLTYAIKFTGSWMMERFADLDGLENLDILPELAATAAGLKGLCTFLTAIGIEDLRKACGGHGYLLASGVAALSADYVWQTTAEGDYVLMLLQTARFLMKTLRAARQGQSLPGPAGYMAPLKDPKFDWKSLAPKPVKTVAEAVDLNYLQQLYTYRALVAVVSAGADLDHHTTKGLPFDDAFNECAVDLTNAVRAHCLNFMFETFIREVRAVQDKSCQAALIKLATIFGCSFIIDEQWDGLIDNPTMQLIRKGCWETLNALRPDAISFVDAFDLPDRVLQSALGRYDGNVYEALFEAAKKSALNQRDPFIGYEEYLRPHLDMNILHLKNTSFAKL